MIRDFFTVNWRAKLASLFVATAVWYLINSYLQQQNQKRFPIPGTAKPVETSPAIDIGPLGPPVPGSN